MSEWKNEVETLTPDPRKLPPWHLTGIVICMGKYHDRGMFGGIRATFDVVKVLRERWDNTETGEVEMRAMSMMDISNE